MPMDDSDDNADEYTIIQMTVGDLLIGEYV